MVASAGASRGFATGRLLCFRDYCVGCWEVLCVLRDLRVDLLAV